MTLETRSSGPQEVPTRVTTPEGSLESGGLSAFVQDSVRRMAASGDLLVQLTLRDIRIRYKQAVMGFAWAVLMPALVVAAGCVVRLAMAHLSGDPLDRAAIGGITVKALPWSFFVGSLGFATASLAGNASLVSKVYFAREILPTASVLAQSVDTAIGALVVAAALPFLGATASVHLLWVAPILLLLFLVTLGASLLLSCANLFFRDVKYLVQVFLTFGIFFTPVLFDAAMLGERGAPLIMLNPLSPLLEGLRLSVIEGHSLLAPLTVDGVTAWSPWHLAWAALFAVGLLATGILVFRKAEHAFAEFV